MSIRMTSPHRSPITLCALLFLSVACDEGPKLHVHGRVLKADGSAESPAQVSLLCDVGADGSDFAVTDETGSYDVSCEEPGTFRGGYPQLLISRVDGTQFALILLAWDKTTVDAGDIRDWDDAITATRGAEGSVHVSWAAPAQPGAFTFRVNAHDSSPAADDVSLWSEVSDGGKAIIPQGAIEDQPSRIDVQASTDLGGNQLILLSHQVQLAAGGSVSRARGDACTMGDEHGDERIFDACPLTDGRFSSASIPECYHDCRLHRHFTIDLGTPLSFSQVVLHGVIVKGTSSALEIETSSDGINFDAAAQIDAANCFISTCIAELGQNAFARFVRVASGPDAEFQQIGEISVF